MGRFRHQQATHPATRTAGPWRDLMVLLMWLAALRIEGNAPSTPLAWSAVWPDVPDPARNTLYDVAEVPGSGGTNVWAVGGRGTMLHWNGHTWKKIVVPTTENLRSVVMARPDFGMAVGDNAAIVHWDGTNWSKKTVPAASWFKSVVLTPGGPSDEAWTAGDQASIGLLWKWTGTGWTNRVAGANQQFSGTGWGLSMVATNDGWLVGERLKLSGSSLKMLGQILRWNGSQWNDLATAPTSKLHAIQMLSPTNGWIVGEAGFLGRWNGTNWVEWLPKPVTQHLWDVSFLSPDHGWAVGEVGSILRWNGATWSNVPSPTTLELRGVTMVSTNSGWAVGSGGTILLWNGSAWQRAAQPFSPRLVDVAMAPAGPAAWAVGESSLTVQRNAGTWQTVSSTGFSYYAVQTLSATQAWAFGPGGRFYRWNGGPWTEIGRWLSAKAFHMFSATQGVAVGWGTIQTWDGAAWSSVTSPTTKTLYGLHALSPSNIWAVGDNGAILHGDGVIWSNVPSPVSHWLTGISMVSPTNGWIVGNFGTILNWNGSVWTNLTNSPTSVQLNGVAVRQSGNDVMGWAVGADGHLCWLSNGLWRAGASPTMQSLLAVDMISPHEAWAVGDHGVLLHWKDQVGLRLLTNGLIEIDWAGQALETATAVSGTWTTVQDNAGPPGTMTPGESMRFFRAR